jgi:hypothetical protein
VPHYETCPACDSPESLLVTDRHARGYNTVGAAGGQLEPVHGMVVRARCESAACGAEFERGDYDAEWQPTS